MGSSPDDLGLVFLPLEGRDRILDRVLGDVVIGQDVAVGRDEEPRPLDDAPIILGLGLAGRGPAEEPVPEIVEGPLVLEALLLSRLFLMLADDLDDRRPDLLRDPDEIEVRPDLGSRGGIEVRRRGRGRRIDGGGVRDGGMPLGQDHEYVARDEESEGESGDGHPYVFFHFFLQRVEPIISISSAKIQCSELFRTGPWGQALHSPGGQARMGREAMRKSISNPREKRACSSSSRASTARGNPPRPGLLLRRLAARGIRTPSSSGSRRAGNGAG